MKKQNAFAYRNFDADKIFGCKFIVQGCEWLPMSKNDAEILQNFKSDLKTDDLLSLERTERELKNIRRAITNFNDRLMRHNERLKNLSLRIIESAEVTPEISQRVKQVKEMSNNYAHIAGALIQRKEKIEGIMKQCRQKIEQAYREKFAANLKKARQKRGLTQRQLADMIQMSPNLIAPMELGNSQPSLMSLSRIAKALQVSADELLFS